MNDYAARSRLLLGSAGVDKLARSHVILLGLGGVGGYTAEALTRAGIGRLTLIDRDTVSETNLNRQVAATRECIGMPKTEALAMRLRAIRPDIELDLRQTFWLPCDPLPGLETADYVIDAIDTVVSKVELAFLLEEKGIPHAAAMGCGNRLSPLGFTVTDIYSTSGCPLCKVMRRELKKRGVKKLTVVYSPDPASPREEPATEEALEPGKKQITASLPYVVGVAGLLLAYQAVQDLTEGLRPE